MFLGRPIRTKKTECPYCNHLHDGASQINGNNSPNPGDVSICVACANVSIFDDNLGLRKPSPEESVAFEGDQNIKEAQRAVFESYLISVQWKH